jgi:poly-beta-1,6-N-acetyl-D-glucosamine synthase
MLHELLRWTVVACFAFLLTVYALYGGLLLASLVDGRRRRREHRAEDFETLLASRFTIPEGPDSVRSLVSQRERWQRVIMETVWHYRGMACRPRYRTVGLVGWPFSLLSEVTAPIFEALSVAALSLSLALGVFDWETFVLLLGAMAFVNAAMTASAILLDDLTSRAYRRRDLVRLLALAPFDLVLYRPIIAWARAKGLWRFLRGDKDWHKFERNVRMEAVT